MLLLVVLMLMVVRMQCGFAEVGACGGGGPGLEAVCRAAAGAGTTAARAAACHRLLHLHCKPKCPNGAVRVVVAVIICVTLLHGLLRLLVMMVMKMMMVVCLLLLLLMRFEWILFHRYASLTHAMVK